jgi:two-component system cell cycle response regulator
MLRMVEEKSKVKPSGEELETVTNKQPEETYEIEERTSYLVEESKPTFSFKLFNQEIHQGRKALCITRQNPKRLRDKYHWEDVPIIWLTNNNLAKEQCIDPTNLSRLSIEIVNFVKETKNGIIMLEGLEYLISQNSYQIILRFIQLINDKIMLSNGIIIVPIDPLILSERELHLLERDMKLYEK